MNDDIVERLRNADTMTKAEVADTLTEAANLIEQMRAILADNPGVIWT